MALTERLAILIDAKSGGAVTEFKKAAKAADDLGESAQKSGSLVGRAGERFGVSATALKAGLATAAVAAGGALVKFGADAVQAASELNEQISGTRVQFGDASESVLEFAKDAASALGLAQTDALQASNNFGAFFTNVGIGQKTAADLSTGLVQLSADIASFKNVAGGAAEVAESLRSGLSGETEPLRKFGIFLDDASTKSKAMELGLGGANRELTAGEKIIARYSQILEQTGKAQGDFARTSDSLANQQRILAAQTENLKASLGTSGAPVVAGYVSGLNDILRASNAVSQSVGGLAKVQTAAGKAASAGFAGPIAVATQFVRGLREESEKAGNKTEQFEEAVRRYAQVAGDADASTGALAEAKRDLRVAANAAKKEQDALNASLVTDEQRAKDAKAAHDNLKTTLLSTINAQRAHERAVQGVKQAQLVAAAKQAELNELLRQGAVDAKEVAAAEKVLARAHQATADAQDRVVEAQKRIEELERGPSDQDKEQRSIDLADARLDVADAESELADTRADSESTARDVERAELRLREAKLNLARVEGEQLISTEELERARKDLKAAQDGVTEASVNEWQAAENLNKVRAGDPDFLAKVTGARWDLYEAQKGVNDAEFNAATSAITLRDNLDASRQSLVDNRDAAAQVRWELQQLANMPIMQQILGGGRLPTATTFLPNGSPLNAPTGRAVGGPVSANTSYLVGERGPELLTMGSRGGYVTPNGAIGGGPSTINVYMAPGSDGDDVVAALARWQRRNGPVPINVKG